MRIITTDGGPEGPDTSQLLHLDVYVGGTLRAQVVALLHEYSDVVGYSQQTEEISAASNFPPKIPKLCCDIAAPKWKQPENTSLRSCTPKQIPHPIEIHKLAAVFGRRLHPLAEAKRKSKRKTAFALIKGHAELLTHLFFDDSDFGVPRAYRGRYLVIARC